MHTHFSGCLTDCSTFFFIRLLTCLTLCLLALCLNITSVIECLISQVHADLAWSMLVCFNSLVACFTMIYSIVVFNTSHTLCQLVAGLNTAKCFDTMLA